MLLTLQRKCKKRGRKEREVSSREGEREGGGKRKEGAISISVSTW